MFINLSFMYILEWSTCVLVNREEVQNIA